MRDGSNDIERTGGEAQFYNQISSKGAVISIGIAVGGFGALCLLGALRNGLSRVDADKIVLLVLGSAVAVNAGLFLRFTLGPRITLTDHHLKLRKWIGSRSWRFSDMTGLASFRKKIRPRALGPGVNRRIVGLELTVQTLAIKTRDGTVSQFVLPAFGGNTRLLEALEAKTELPVLEFPDDGTDFQEWKKRIG